MSFQIRRADFDAAMVDLDGTMVDTLGDFVAALNLMLDDLALPQKLQLDRHTVEKMVGKGSENLIHSVLNHVEGQCQSTRPAINLEVSGVPALDFDKAYAAYQKHYTNINGKYSQVYPGVPEGLTRLRQSGLKLACLTNKPLAFAEDLLRQKGLDEFFSCVFGGDSFTRKKPDPLPLLKTCEALGTQPSRTLMVGDSGNDAQAARAAACPVVLVTYGYNHGQPVRAEDADGFVESLDGLLPQK